VAKILGECVGRCLDNFRILLVRMSISACSKWCRNNLTIYYYSYTNDNRLLKQAWIQGTTIQDQASS